MPIRVALAEDWERVRDVRLAALREAPDAFATTYEATEDQPPWRWQSWVTGEGSRTRTAIFVDEPAPDADFTAMATGAIFNDEPTTAHLFAMWVRPDMRGAGIGRALVAEVLAWARERGAGHVFLRVTDGNDGARGLYEACGFTADEDDREQLRESSALSTIAMMHTL
jgi:GNAT superfamily N-acetyltransferase